jgi:hypothetical protein
VDLGFFYDDLAPYGNWIERPSYGWVRTPRAFSTSWHPYQNGHWVWSDEGWVWVSDEPYGWATYHYGRWYDDPEIGWSWVPGDDWAPAWVSWQEGGDHVGWAPLPPGVNISVSYGRGYGDYAYGIAPEDYTFVPEQRFLAPRIADYVLPQAQIYPIFGRTRNWTNYRNQGGRWFNQGVPVDRFQRFARVPRYQVADLGANYADYRRRGGARFAGNRLELFRPQVQKARVAPPISRAAARRAVMSAAQFKAANPNRVARMNQRQNRQFQQAQMNQRQVRVDQRQGRFDQRQARVDRQQGRVDRRQQAEMRGQGLNNKAMQRQGRMNQMNPMNPKQARIDQRQTRVDRQRVRVDRQQMKGNQQQQRQAEMRGRGSSFRQQQKAMAQQQRQAQVRGRGPSFRQQQKAMAQQQRQVRVDRRQTRVDRQQVRVDRRQAGVDRQQLRAQRQQMRGGAQQQWQAQGNRQQARAQRQQQQAWRNNGGGGGGGRQHGQGGGQRQGGGGNPRHQRGGGRG